MNAGLTIGGDTWWQALACLTVALLLTTAVGFERQLHRKSAGMRTHSLVGVGAALFMIVSKYGFDDVVRAGVVSLDPSRVAAQIVSGIGFIGAGLVFVRQNKVRGLTTAASIWLVAAIGSAAGAGLVVPAAFVTAMHFLVAHVYPWITRRTSLHSAHTHTFTVRYKDGMGTLRLLLPEFTRLGFQIQGFEAHRSTLRELDRPLLRDDDRRHAPADPLAWGDEVEVEVEAEGIGPVATLAERISSLPGVVAVRIGDDND